jgi:hypothetical protein
VLLDGHLGQLGWRGIEAFSERESSEERERGERKWGAVQPKLALAFISLSLTLNCVFPFLSHWIQTPEKLMKIERYYAERR